MVVNVMTSMVLGPLYSKDEIRKNLFEFHKIIAVLGY